MSDRAGNKGFSRLMIILASIGIAIATIAGMLLLPRVALAGGIDPDGYVSSFEQENGLGTSNSSDMLQQNGFETYGGGEVLSGFDIITSTMTGLMLGFVPVLFIIKFAGRAMLSITHSGSSNGKLDIPTFFMTSEERSGDPQRGGAKDGTSWYIAMGKDFLRYFGVAVAVWLVFAAIINGINLLMGLSGAPSQDADSFMGQFNS